jgi:hypothetical protein
MSEAIPPLPQYALMAWCLLKVQGLYLNIITDLKKIGWEVVEWMCLAQDRVQWRTLVNTVMNLWVP